MRLRNREMHSWGYGPVWYSDGNAWLYLDPGSLLLLWRRDRSLRFLSITWRVGRFWRTVRPRGGYYGPYGEDES